MTSFRRVLSKLTEDLLFVFLVLVLLPLLWLTEELPWHLHHRVDWKTVGALAGLMVLSRGLEVSGYLTTSGQWLLTHVSSERLLAASLVLFAALLSAIITNDVALFIVVPLTLSLKRLAHLPVGRLIIFQAFAVNAGSAVSPIGNPQNLFLWQSSELSFLAFIHMMIPLATGLLFILLVLIPLAFPRRIIMITASPTSTQKQQGLFWLSLLLYIPFLVLTDWGFAPAAALSVILLYFVCHRSLLRGVDWLLLCVFVLMFINLSLLAQLPFMQQVAARLLELPGDAFTASVLTSQILSNVPAAIFLHSFTDDIKSLTWGVSVGGFGLALGSLANLIALRLARDSRLWFEFHLWSLPILFVAFAVAWLLLF